jgi:hypothetical protein
LIRYVHYYDGDAAAAASLVSVYDMTERAEEGVLQVVLGTTGCCCCCRRQKCGSETKPESLRGCGGDARKEQSRED